MSVPVLILHDGRRVELDDDIVLGRAPVAPDSAPSARSVSVSVQTVSKTHALIGADATGVWVVDLGSSNGTEVLSPSGEGRRIEPGVRTPVSQGENIRVGTDTLLSIDHGGPDLDRTIVRPAPDPGVVPVQPGTQGKPLGERSQDVDWSAEPAPPPGRPTPPVSAPDAPAPQIAAEQPPAAAPPAPDPAPRVPDPAPPAPNPAPPVPDPAPPAAAPVAPPAEPPPPSAPPSPATVDIGSVAPQQQPPPPVAGQPAPPAFSAGPSFVAPPTATSSSGLGAANIIGLVLLTLWGVVTTLRLLDVVFGIDFGFFDDGFVLRFFRALTTDELDFFELFGVATLPSFLGFVTYVGTIGTSLVAIAALASRNRAIRALVVLPLLVHFFLWTGFVVFAFREDVDFVDFIVLQLLPGFVLPFIGLFLALLPGGSSSSPPAPAPQPSFGQPGPPFGGPQ